MVFLKLHTSQTIRELIKDERLFAKHYDKLTATIYDGCKSYYFISRSDVEKTVDGLSERYGISFDF